MNTQITLKNIDDVKQAKKGLITEPEIRQATVNVMVDTVNQTLVGVHGDKPMYCVM